MPITIEVLNNAIANIQNIEQKLQEINDIISISKRGMIGNQLIQKTLDDADKQTLINRYNTIKSELVTLFQELP